MLYVYIYMRIYTYICICIYVYMNPEKLRGRQKTVWGYNIEWTYTVAE